MAILSSMGFLGGSDGKESACNGRPRFVPVSGKSPGEGNGNPLQYSCLEICQWGSKESDTTE